MVAQAVDRVATAFRAAPSAAHGRHEGLRVDGSVYVVAAVLPLSTDLFCDRLRGLSAVRGLRGEGKGGAHLVVFKLVSDDDYLRDGQVR